MTTFGEELLRVRKERGMTQEQLATALQTSRSNISHWENGRTMPDLDTARRLSQVLNYNFFAEVSDAGDLSPASSAPLAPSQDDACAGEPTSVEVSPAPVEAPSPKKPRRVKPWMLFAAAALVAAISLVLVLLPKKNPQGEAQVVFEPQESIVYQDAYSDMGRGWKMYLTMRNESDTPFSPEKILIRFYDKNDKELSLLRLDTDLLLRGMESNTLIRGETTAVYDIGTNRLSCDHAVAMLLGTDANGHAQEYTCQITLSNDTNPNAVQ